MEAFGLWEGTALLWIQENLRGVLDPLVCLYTKLGDHGLVWIALCAVLLLFPRTRRAGLAGALGLVLSLVCTNIIIKPLAARTRPWLLLEGLVPLVVERDPYSFPSGHSSAAFACAGALWGTLPRHWRNVGLVCAGLMALSRLYVGVHFPSDVVCGSLVGALCGWGACRILRWREEKRGMGKGCSY